MSTTDDNNDNSTTSCANCGKEGGDLNSCNRCKLVKYCNAACKKKHRSKHKKKCDRRVAEMHDEALFKQPPQQDECPICFLCLPTLGTGIRYRACCGKVICSGCIVAPVYDNNGNKVEKKCPFCRAPAHTSGEELMKRIRKRVEMGDSIAIYNLGCHYAEGDGGLPQDRGKALELYHRAAELGYTESYTKIGYAYLQGYGVQRDEKKAQYYWELAAIGGVVKSRHNLGILEKRAGNYDRALKNFMIAVGMGYNESLKQIKQFYIDGHGTKDDYAKALQAYQTYLSEIKSIQRDKAFAFSDAYKYYE